MFIGLFESQIVMCVCTVKRSVLSLYWSEIWTGFAVVGCCENDDSLVRHPSYRWHHASGVFGVSRESVTACGLSLRTMSQPGFVDSYLWNRFAKAYERVLQ